MREGGARRTGEQGGSARGDAGFAQPRRVGCLAWASTARGFCDARLDRHVGGATACGGGANVTLPCRQLCHGQPRVHRSTQRAMLRLPPCWASALCVPDGIRRAVERPPLASNSTRAFTGSDGIYRIYERAAAWLARLLSGAAPGIAERTAQALQARYPGWP